MRVQRQQALRERLADVVYLLRLSTEAGMSHVSGPSFTPRTNPNKILCGGRNGSGTATRNMADSLHCLVMVCLLFATRGRGLIDLTAESSRISAVGLFVPFHSRHSMVCAVP